LINYTYYSIISVILAAISSPFSKIFITTTLYFLPSLSSTVYISFSLYSVFGISTVSISSDGLSFNSLLPELSSISF